MNKEAISDLVRGDSSWGDEGLLLRTLPYWVSASEVERDASLAGGLRRRLQAMSMEHHMEWLGIEEDDEQKESRAAKRELSISFLSTVAEVQRTFKHGFFLGASFLKLLQGMGKEKEVGSYLRFGWLIAVGASGVSASVESFHPELAYSVTTRGRTARAHTSQDKAQLLYLMYNALCAGNLVHSHHTKGLHYPSTFEETHALSWIQRWTSAQEERDARLALMELREEGLVAPVEAAPRLYITLCGRIALDDPAASRWRHSPAPSPASSPSQSPRVGSPRTPERRSRSSSLTARFSKTLKMRKGNDAPEPEAFPGIKMHAEPEVKSRAKKRLSRKSQSRVSSTRISQSRISQERLSQSAITQSRLSPRLGASSRLELILQPEVLYDEANMKGSLNVLRFDPRELARQVTLVMHAAYKEISSLDLMRCRWGAPVRALMRACNELTLWGATEVLTVPREMGKREDVVSQLMHMAQELLALHNYAAAVPLVLSLQKASVERLCLLPLLDRDDQLLWKSSLKPLSDVSRYREALAAVPPKQPVIPYLAVHLQDLTFIEENNPTLLESDVYNLEKLKMVDEEVSACICFQERAYKLAELPDVQNWWRSGRVILDDEVLLAQSYKVKPPPDA